MSVELLLDTNVVSYLFKGGVSGAGYSDLIGNRAAGVTLLTLSELRSGVVRADWGMKRIVGLDNFLSKFLAVPGTREVADICGAMVGRSYRVGRRLAWPDAWAAATAIWLDVPLVTHDRDLEAIPDLRVLTLHHSWQVRDEPALFDEPPILPLMTAAEIAEAEEEFAREFGEAFAFLDRSSAHRRIC